MEPYTLDPETQHPNTLKIVDQFDVYRVPYKHVNSHPIYAFFVVPKSLASSSTGPRPVLVRYHGGAMSEGEADASLRPFFLEMIRDSGGVLITPDYRLRPEHELADSIEDSSDFWLWLGDGGAQTALNSLSASQGVTLDAHNVLVAGESAGGYYAAQSALLGIARPSTTTIRCLFIQYAALKIGQKVKEETYGVADGDDRPVGEQRVPYSVVEEHLAALEPGHVCSRAKFGSRMHLAAAMMQHDRLADLSGDNAYLDPWNSVETAGKMPPILLYHSKEDEPVPWQHTEEWAAKFRKLQPDVPVHLSYQKGEHIFDKDDTVDTPWLKEPLEFVAKYWPAR